MSDLISRQTAIDDIETVNPSMPLNINWVKNWVKTLPSAQSEVIRCKECEWFRKEYGWNCIEYTVCGVSPTHHPIRREDDFCSYAERKEQDDG